ncbi:MAG: hypothetical protein ACI4NG_00075, partial [Candidatus Gallimonas sp.]
ENDYLDFKSAKLDGSDVRSYFRVSDNATEYRFVQKGETVYLLYADGSDLHSYNVATETDTTLVKNTESHVFNETDKTDPCVYYTMNVVDGDDKDSPNQLKYTQVYRVSADATEAPYEYSYDETYLDENDGVAPYHNLGSIVLDGIGKTGIKTQYTHDLTDGVEAIPTIGYTYSLLKYDNGGLYFTRTDLTSTGGTTGESGRLYYLSADKLQSGWNSVSGNAESNLDVVAQDTTKASASAIFYYDGGHHYLYVSGATIIRADVGANGAAQEQVVARNVSGATLSFLGDGGEYKYVYFYRTSGSGVSVERAVYNGTADKYSNLAVQKNYRPVKVLDVVHAASWYPYEIVGGFLFYADASELGATSYQYVRAVDLRDANGALADNETISALNDRYEEVQTYFEDLSETNAELSTAINCYYYTGTAQYFDDNLAEAAAAGKAEDYLYSADDRAAFYAYVEGKEGETDLAFKEYRTRAAFILSLGAMSEADQTSYNDYWHTTLEKYTAEETETGLPAWAWALIGVAIGVVVIVGAIVIVLVVKKKKKNATRTFEPKLAVDTTDDRSVDVYSYGDADAPQEELAEESADQAQEEPAEESADQAQEEPAEQAEENGNKTQE